MSEHYFDKDNWSVFVLNNPGVSQNVFSSVFWEILATERKDWTNDNNLLIKTQFNHQYTHQDSCSQCPQSKAVIN